MIFKELRYHFTMQTEVQAQKNSVLLSFKLYELIIASFWNHGFLELFLPKETICSNL